MMPSLVISFNDPITHLLILLPVRSVDGSEWARQRVNCDLCHDSRVTKDS